MNTEFIFNSIKMLFIGIFFTLSVFKLIKNIHSNVISNGYKNLSKLISLTFPLISIYFIYMYLIENNGNISMYFNINHIFGYFYNIFKSYILTKIIFYFIYKSKYIKNILIESEHLFNIDKLTEIKFIFSNFHSKLLKIAISKEISYIEYLINFNKFINEYINLYESEIESIYEVHKKTLKITFLNIFKNDTTEYTSLIKKYYKLSISLHKKDLLTNKLISICNFHIKEQKPIEYSNEELSNFLVKLKNNN